MVLEDLKKAYSLGLRGATMTTEALRKELGYFVKAGKITAAEAKRLLSFCLKEGNDERKRVTRFITSELERELRRAADFLSQKPAKKSKKRKR